ncbi:HD domain-containing protein [Nocardioides terrisoli]|uniref:HD domain-containing protein n=1 Tax=Nocardioides terrisoli TaxID=3388267 RepID=UPI00287BAECB|nr:HD domain-containing protein [Nocardioides marmorisolisilvae]
MDLGTADQLARHYLDGLLGRLAHVRATGETARNVAQRVCPDDELVLACAGLMHDIGYSPALSATGFHPLDGARWLRTLGEERLSCLVAHHSGARWEAGVRGLSSELDEFPLEDSIAADVLTFADLTTGPRGDQVDIDQRIADIRRRYPREHPVTVALARSEPHLREVVARVQGLLPAPLLN